MRKGQSQVDAEFAAGVDRQQAQGIWCPLNQSLNQCPRFGKKCDGINCSAGFSKEERRDWVNTNGR